MKQIPLLKSASILVFGLTLATSPVWADGTPQCNDSFGFVAGTECGTDSVAVDNATAVGNTAVAGGVGSVAVGMTSTANGFVAIAIGQAATAPADNSVAIGFLANSAGIGSIAAGVGAQAIGENSIAIGNNANAAELGSIAIGANSTASAANSVALGDGSVADQANTVSVGTVGGERRIVNVAVGTAGTDAVNFSQLTATNNAITSTNTALASETTARTAGDTALGSRIDNLSFSLDGQRRRDRRDARAGTSAALAAAGLPQASDPGKSMIAGGFGYYRGRAGFAIGGSHRVADGNTVFKIGVTYDTSKTVGANGGVGFQF